MSNSRPALFCVARWRLKVFNYLIIKSNEIAKLRPEGLMRPVQFFESGRPNFSK